MKPFPFLASLLVLTSCIDQNTPSEEKLSTPKPLSIEEITAIEKQGIALYQSNTQEAVAYFRQASHAYQQIKAYGKAGTTNLNIAGAFDEQLGQPDSALQYAQIALNLFQQAQDSNQMANLYKYRGLLKGKAGLFDEAHADILKAIDLYQQIDYPAGVAVSNVNLANIYFQAKQFQASDSLFHIAQSYWKEQGNHQRVFINNLFGIELYGTWGKATETQALIAENQSLMDNVNLNQYLKNRFETLLEEYP